MDIPQRVLDRLWVRVDIRGPDECWPWKLGIGNHGYGFVGWWDKDHGQNCRGHKGSARSELAHRAAWVATHGPIPDGLTVDHQKDLGCGGGICCNPAHLRLLTNKDNGRDNQNLRKTHCPAGHLYDEANTYRDGRGRRCRECARDRDRTPERVAAQRVRRARRVQEGLS